MVTALMFCIMPVRVGENPPFTDLVPKGWLKVSQVVPRTDCILGNFQPSLRDWSVSRISSQDCVLGYSQPSLRDLNREWWVHTHAR